MTSTAKLTGLAGKHGLTGSDANDLLKAGAAAETLDGGIGTDTISYQLSTAAVHISLDGTPGRGGFAAGDRLFNFENLTGSRFSDVLTGNALANVLVGLSGNDWLMGMGGNDTLRGGKGNDHLIGGAGADILNGGEGNDWVSYRSSPGTVKIDLATRSALGGDAQGDRLTSIENVEGSAFNDVLQGNNAANVLYGNDGLDIIHGGGGDDWLEGGGGADFLTGSAGIDKIFGGDGDDLIDAGTGRDIIKGGAGNDVIYGGPDPDVIVYDFAWQEIHAWYNADDWSIWVDAPDGRDHIFTALTIATLTGTYRYDVPTESWVFESTMTGADWFAT